MLALRILILLLSLVLPSAAYAADAVQLRLSDRQDYVRLVLAWENGETPDYDLKQIDPQTVEVQFKKPGALPKFAPDRAFPEIADVRQVSDETQPLKIWVMLAEDGFKRDLTVGNRLIIDVAQSKDLRDKQKRADAAATADGAAKNTAPEPVKAEEPKVAPVVENTPEQVPEKVVAPAKTPAAMPTPVPTTQGVEVPAPTEKVIVKAVEKPAAPPVTNIITPKISTKVDPLDASNPPIVTLTDTSPFGLASFIYNQQLWIVVDQPDFLITPRLTGNKVARFKPFERLDLKDATVFYTDLPPGLNIARSEGGDLYWRVVLAPPKPTMAASDPERHEDNGVRSIVWPMKTVNHLITLRAPDTEEKMTVITVKKSTDFSGAERRFSEFVAPLGAAGLAVIPLVDDLKIETGDVGVTITRDGGLSVTSALDAAQYKADDLPAPPSPEESDDHASVAPKPEPLSTAENNEPVQMLDGRAPLYRFERWSMGGVGSLDGNESALIADLAEKKEDERAGGLMNIGKMYLASGRGSEAVGYFRLAAEMQQGLADTADFHGLRGAAYAINGQFDLAYEDLRNPGLDTYPDVNVWRAYSLAHLQDWRQAGEKMGNDVSWLRQYPVMISQPMMLTFAEIALRAGNAKQAEKILNLIDPAGGAGVDAKNNVSAILSKPYVAEREYLLGEAARQSGKKEEARKYWDALTKSDDNKQRARARLALTVMNYEEGKIKVNQALDQLEGLRYAWRGDELESSISTHLGQIYLDKGDYLRGLNVLRDASSLAPDTEAGKRITAMMTDAFRALFLSDKMKSIDPIDAITVYEKFSELIPAGPEANRLTINLVDRLMEVDLLDRAARVMTDLVDHRLDGDQRVEISLRLAATYLLNRQPQQALSTLNKTEGMFGTIGNPDTIAKRKRELTLLRARAMFQSDQVDSALSLLGALPEDEDVLKAHADIAWQTGRWSDASGALEKLLATIPVTADKPPTTAQANLIRNLAVATNLSGDRGRLTQLRADYLTAMQQTDLFKEFDVVTRERQTPTLADRDSLNKLVSEVDIFGSFLNAYRATNEASAVKQGVTPTSVQPAAATDKPADAALPAAPDAATATTPQPTPANDATASPAETAAPNAPDQAAASGG